MRIKLRLKPESKGEATLPINYQYPLSAWIYHTIALGNHELAYFLHNKGYGEGVKSFKLFTFGMLDFSASPYRITGDRITFSGGNLFLIISFLIPEALEGFIQGIFAKQAISIGDPISSATLIIETVEIMPEPDFNNPLFFRTISPVIVSVRNEERKTAEYCTPEHPRFSECMLTNLTNKYVAALSTGLILNTKQHHEATTSEPTIRILSTPRKKGITIKAGTPQETKLIGYLFDFKLEAPMELIKIGYHAGFGEKNGLGMGCCEVISKQIDIY